MFPSGETFTGLIITFTGLITVRPHSSTKIYSGVNQPYIILIQNCTFFFNEKSKIPLFFFNEKSRLSV